LKIAIISLLAISIFGCQTTFTPPKGFVKINESKERKGSLGFSFMTPTGENWYEGFNPNSLVYLKKTEPSKLSFFAGATEVQFQSESKTDKDLLDFVKSYKKIKNKSRFKNPTTDLTINKVNGIVCVNYKEQAEDHKAKSLGSHSFLIMTNVGRVCMEPKEKNKLVDIHYSIRSVPKLNIDNFVSEGNEFINSLVYKS